MKVSTCRGCKVSQNHLMFLLKILMPSYQSCTSCFLEAIDPIFNMFKNMLRRLFVFFRRPSFPSCLKCPLFNHYQISRHKNEHVSAFPLNYLDYLSVPKDKSYWSVESWTRPPSPETKQMRVARVFLKLIMKYTSPK